jgi:hypothetical protein
MQGNYGARFLNQWRSGQMTADGQEDIGIRNAMAVWGRALAGFVDHPKALAIALDNLPDSPPTLPEFVTLCRETARRDRDDTSRLPYQPTPDERARADEAARAASGAVSVAGKLDPKAWAKKLKARNEAGESLLPVQISSYLEAMSLDEKVA